LCGQAVIQIHNVFVHGVDFNLLRRFTQFQQSFTARNVTGLGNAPVNERGSLMSKAQGFAALTPERRRELSRLGGRAAHRNGTARVWTPEEAKVAGRKGGLVSRGGRGKIAVSLPDDLDGAA
jgi:general stress protein YciG